MKKTYLLLVFISSLFLSSCGNQGYDYSNIKITEVIDGDTVVLENGRRLRLIGIDTPEVHVKKDGVFVYQPAPYAREATEFVKGLSLGKYARIEFDVDKKDKYSRLLGYCFIKDGQQDLFLNSLLLKKGLAVLYTYPPNVKYVDDFVEAQQQARLDNRGLWGSYAPLPADQAADFIGQIRTVKGRVLSTYNSGKVIFLNFGRDYKTDFTVAIFKNCWDYFYKKSINPETYYRGRVVEVTGRIRQYNGPEIIVNYPSAIIIQP